jgi:hypothetical protein
MESRSSFKPDVFHHVKTWPEVEVMDLTPPHEAPRIALRMQFVPPSECTLICGSRRAMRSAISVAGRMDNLQKTASQLFRLPRSCVAVNEKITGQNVCPPSNDPKSL